MVSSSAEALRILLVEDSPVVAPFTAELLNELGHEVVGPAPNMASAWELIEAEEFDAAMLDVHIRGDRVFGLCEALDAKDVPFVLTSGYAAWDMPDKWVDRPRLQKPYTIEDVERAIEGLIAERSSRSAHKDNARPK